jgi:hypothetical protein
MTKAALLSATTLPEDAQQQLLTPERATVFVEQKYGISFKPRTWRERRRNGSGPRYRRCGNTIVYTAAAIDEWMLERFGNEVRSTTEEAALRLKSETNYRRREAPGGEGKLKRGVDQSCSSARIEPSPLTQAFRC